MRKNAMIGVIFILFASILLSACSWGGNKDKIEKYRITFNSNGGTVVESIEFKNNSEITIPESPTKENYLFYGWYLDNATFENRFDLEYIVDNEIKNNITVYAKWMDTNDVDAINLILYNSLNNTIDAMFNNAGFSINYDFEIKLRDIQNYTKAKIDIILNENGVDYINELSIQVEPNSFVDFEELNQNLVNKIYTNFVYNNNMFKITKNNEDIFYSKQAVLGEENELNDFSIALLSFLQNVKNGSTIFLLEEFFQNKNINIEIRYLNNNIILEINYNHLKFEIMVDAVNKIISSLYFGEFENANNADAAQVSINADFIFKGIDHKIVLNQNDNNFDSLEAFYVNYGENFSKSPSIIDIGGNGVFHMAFMAMAPATSGNYITIVSASMEPTIKKGSIIEVSQNVTYNDIEVDDIVVFKTSSSSGMLVAHRVVGKVELTRELVMAPEFYWIEHGGFGVVETREQIDTINKPFNFVIEQNIHGKAIRIIPQKDPDIPTESMIIGHDILVSDKNTENILEIIIPQNMLIPGMIYSINNINIKKENNEYFSSGDILKLSLNFDFLNSENIDQIAVDEIILAINNMFKNKNINGWNYIEEENHYYYVYQVNGNNEILDINFETVSIIPTQLTNEFWGASLQITFTIEYINRL